MFCGCRIIIRHTRRLRHLRFPDGIACGDRTTYARLIIIDGYAWMCADVCVDCYVCVWIMWMCLDMWCWLSHYKHQPLSQFHACACKYLKMGLPTYTQFSLHKRKVLLHQQNVESSLVDVIMLVNACYFEHHIHKKATLSILQIQRKSRLGIV